jgi:hypothetical protein
MLPRVAESEAAPQKMRPACNIMQESREWLRNFVWLWESQFVTDPGTFPPEILETSFFSMKLFLILSEEYKIPLLSMA